MKTILFFFSLLSVLVGYIIGKYQERAEWNHLIQEGILPKPKKNKIKKLSITLLFAFSTIVGYCQTNVHVYKSQVGKWNENKSEWVYGDYNFVDLTFTIAKTYVTCNDKANSFYTINSDAAGRNTSDYKTNKWYCTDERNRRCTFSITKYIASNTLVLSVMYDDTLFSYYVGDSGTLDRLN